MEFKNDLPLLFYRSPSNDPYYNLALEEYLFNNFGNSHNVFMLWQNDNTIVVGKNQNTIAEIVQPVVDRYGITVARRLSGGGAVYHDLGNLNFTLIVDNKTKEFDFSYFCLPIIHTLARFGVTASLSSRNDITVAGKKFSGNAQYSKQGVTMHHGTILFDSDLTMVAKALKVKDDKVKTKAVASSGSQVTNLKTFLPPTIQMADFETTLLANVFETPYSAYQPEFSALKTITELRNDKYALWQWNFGSSPDCDIVNAAYVSGCGHIELHMTIAEGRIKKIYSYGDYFGNVDFAYLQVSLLDCRYDRQSIEEALAQVEVSEVFFNLNNRQFIDIVLGN